VGNVSTTVCAKFRCSPLCIKKALGIFKELITTTTTRVAFLGPTSGSKKYLYRCRLSSRTTGLFCRF